MVSSKGGDFRVNGVKEKVISVKKEGKKSRKKRGGGLGNYLVQGFVGNHEALDIEVRPP
jgi:hypothetical protein